MSDLRALLDALGPEPPPAPPPASFFKRLASDVLGLCTTDPAAIYAHVAELFAAEGWRLVDRTAECRPPGEGPAFLAPPGPNELIFLARAPATEARLAALAKIYPANHPAGIPYLPVTPAAALIGRTAKLLIKALEGAPAPLDVSELVRKEEKAQAAAFCDAEEAFCYWAPLFSAQGLALVDWTGRVSAGGVLPLAAQECAFVGRVLGAEADFEELVWSLCETREEHPQLCPVAVAVGLGVHLRLPGFREDSDPDKVGPFAQHDSARDPEAVRRKILGSLREGWRLVDRTAECRPEDTDPRRLFASGENELVFLAHAPQSAPLFAAAAATRSPLLPEGATYVQTTPLAMMLNRERCMRIFTEECEQWRVRFMMGERLARPVSDREGAASDREGAASDDRESAASDGESAASDDRESAASDRESAASDDSSAASDGESAVSDGESAVSDGESAVSDGESAASDRESAASDDSSAAADPSQRKTRGASRFFG